MSSIKPGRAALFILGVAGFAVVQAQRVAARLGQGVPAARACHSAAYHAPSAGIVVLGGANECGGKALDDDRLWLLRGDEWSVIGRGGPGAREDAVLVSDSRRGVLVLFGGRRNGVVHDDTWEWKAGNWRQVPTTISPGKLEHAAAAFDSSRGRVVLFGGAVAGRFSAVTWEWNGDEWRRGDASGPEARVGHAMADAPGNGVMMYGGFSPAGQFRDYWRWNGNAWARISDDGPTTSEGHTLVSTPEGMVIAGPGVAGGEVTRVWRHATGTGTGTWLPMATGSEPPLRVGSVLVHDHGRRSLVLIGGRAGGAAAADIAVHRFSAR